MKQEEINKFLDDHKLWLESKGEKGKCAYLRGAYLRDTNLQNANLEGASLVGADLSGANLEGANLKLSRVLKTNLRGAKFTIEIRDVADFSCCEITKDQLPWLALHPKFSEFYPTLTVFE